MLKSCFLVISNVKMLSGLVVKDSIAFFSSARSPGIGYGGWSVQTGYCRIILSCFPKNSISLSAACPAVPKMLGGGGGWAAAPPPPAQLRGECLKIGFIFVLMVEMMPWECWTYYSDCFILPQMWKSITEKKIHVFNFLHYPSEGFFLVWTVCLKRNCAGVMMRDVLGEVSRF